ncbi:hypothetical protein RFI_35928, partial [Reticulomyxa filosa]
KSSLEFNVHIQWYNDLSDVHNTHTKWACLILNHTWHFRTSYIYDRDDLSNCISEFNSFHVIWKAVDDRTHKEPLNPHSITFKQGKEHVKEKLQMREHFMYGRDELILFVCKPNMNGSDVLSLHDIYKRLPHYPVIQVHWEIKYVFMVPYKRTIGIERSNLPESVSIQDITISSNQKTKFNPLLYERDLHKLKIIQDAVNVKATRNNSLQKLFHEVIKNKYLSDLIEQKVIKQQIKYNEDDGDGTLILNDKILTILNELKILYHDDIHKQMGYPLQLYEIC